MKKKFQVGVSYIFWVKDPKPKLDLFRPIVDIFREEGFKEQDARVYDGVHDQETGYDSFSAAYSSFSEMDQNLVKDFSEAKKGLDGVWMTTLNFGSMDVDLEKNGKNVNIHYNSGKITIDGDIDVHVMEKVCNKIKECNPDCKDVSEII